MLTLLNLLAAIALLVWGTHIVRTGVLRVFGANLRKVLQRSVSHRASAFAAGLGVTSLLQSATATALLTSSFLAKGLISTAAALAVMLGADVGTAIMVQLFSLDLSWLSPLLIAVGVVVFLSRKNERAGQIGRVLLGLGVMILALQLIMAATAPLTHAAGVKVLFGELTGDILLDVMLGALLALVCYSSLAVVLLTATLAASSVVTLPVALAVVLGANLGSGLLAVVTTLKADTLTRRAPTGNLMFKLAGVALAVLAFPLILRGVDLVELTPQAAVVSFHLAFNLALAALFLPFTDWLARRVEQWLPAPVAAESASTPRYLDPTALVTPAVAIGAAAREAIRVADIVHDMLAGLMVVLKENDRALAERLGARDDEIDRLYTAIKLYLAQVSREALDTRESQRWTDIVQFTINMEHAGDIIDRMLVDVAQKKIDRNLSFSEAGMVEIENLHARLMTNLQLAMTVFLHGDLKTAQKLMAEKVDFRELEMRYAANHLTRLSDNTPASIETSSLHLDLLSDFKRVNSLLCSVAYPILETAGVLSRTRLIEDPLTRPLNVPPASSTQQSKAG
ncbi:MAG: Na/Pi cotransporter family protein [Burkholderiaceae bacterium]